MNIKQIIKECLNKNSIKIQELVNEELNSKTKKLVEDYTPSVSSRLFENDMNHDEIMKGLNSPSLKDRKNAIQHPKATSKHIDKALDDSNWSVRYWAAKHPNVNFQNIEKALSDSHEMVRAAAMNHPNMEKY